ncbi:MAG: carboxypeptidase-like regulatory domain-containing protein [archaeon]
MKISLLIGLLAFASFASAGTIEYYDNWYTEGGTDNDTYVYADKDIFVTPQSINSQADCLCWDWCDSGTTSDETIANWDHCYCKSSTAQTQCMGASTLVNDLCSNGKCSIESLATYHDIDDTSTVNGDGWSCNMDVREYIACGSATPSVSNWLGQLGDPYYVFYPKKFDCDIESGSTQVYDAEGHYYNWLDDAVYERDYVSNISCPVNKACNFTKDDVWVYTASGSIPNPCSIVDGTGPGNICSSDSECLSGDCGGEKTLNTPSCDSDGSIGVGIFQEYFQKTCGGDGYNYDDGGYTALCTSLMGASNFVCDEGLDDQTYIDTLMPSDFCKKALNTSCSVSADCWNDNGGVDCKGTPAICTTGNEGSLCSSTTQCDSGLTCTGGVCSAGGGVGDECTLDSDCQSDICVYTSASSGSCQSSHTPTVDITDSWIESNSNNESTADDGFLFGGESVYPVSNQLRESTDMICYDFDGNGVYDACYYDTNGCGGSGCTASSCNVSGFTIPQSVSSSKKWSCDIDSVSGCKIGVDGGTPPQICSGVNCSISTSNPIFSNEVRAVGFSDCDNSVALKGQFFITGVSFDDSHYTVIKPKYALCENTLVGLGLLNNPNYLSAGFNGSYDQDYFSYICPSNKACDQLNDQQEIFTPNGVISNPCRTIPGQSCTQNSDCLYNTCQGNTCQPGIGIDGILRDEFGVPIVGKTIQLTSCGGGDTVLKSSTTDSKGKFEFYHVGGSYKLKSSAPWGTVTYTFPEGPCRQYDTGFHDIWLQLYTKANIHGVAVNPQGFASVGLPFEAATCQDVTMDTTLTDGDGEFDLTSDAGYQKLLVTIGGDQYPLTDASGSSCQFQYGDVDYGTQIITDNCSLYDNTCSDEYTRLFDCTNDSVSGCTCKTQYCDAGCTDGALVCNPIGTGTLKVVVSDTNGDAIPLAPVQVDGVSSGTTNGFGKKDVNTKHGSHSLKITCPTNLTTQTKGVYLNGDYKYVSFEMECPEALESVVSVNVETIDGYPVGNVYVFLDDETTESALTNGFGTATFTAPYGNHQLVLAYLIEDGVPGSFQVSLPILVDSASETIDHTILLPGQPGYSSSSVQSISPNIAPIVIFGALAVLDIASTAWDAYDYCSCVYSGPDVGQLATQCVSDLFACQIGKIAFNDESCRDAFQGVTKNDSAGKCDEQFGTLVIGLGLSFLPGDELVKLGVRGTKLAKGILHLDDAAEVVKLASGKFSYLTFPKASLTKITDDLYGYVIDGFNYIAKPIASGLDGKPIMFGVVDVIDDPIKLSGKGPIGAEDLAKYMGVGSEIKLKALIGKSPKLSETVIIESYDSLGEIALSNLSKVEYEKVLKKLKDKINESDAGNIEGIIGEVLAGKKYKTQIAQFQVDVFSGSKKVTEIDWILSNGDLVQVKYKEWVSLTNPKELDEIAKQLINTHSYDPNATIRLFLPNISSGQIGLLHDELFDVLNNYSNGLDTYAKLVIEGVD